MIALLIASASALLLALVGTPLFIRLLVRKSYGQFIRDDGPTAHHTKRGTPTMGGAVIVGSVVLAYFATHLIMMAAGGSDGPTVSGLLLLMVTVGMGVVGFFDDYIKISKQRSLGLSAPAKIIGQTLVGVLFAVLALNFPVAMNPGLARIIGVMLKLDFQRAVLRRIPKMTAERSRVWRDLLFVCDEYHAFATVGETDPTGDERTFALSRQARLIPIVATQSVSSLRSALPGDESWRTLLQCFRTKLFLATSDEFTARASPGFRPTGKFSASTWPDSRSS